MYLSSLVAVMMKAVRNPRLVFLATTLSIVGAAPFFSASSPQQGRYFVQIEFATDVRTVAQLFYDIGQGITEEDSVKRTMQPTISPVWVRFPISPGTLRRLRFDPMDLMGKATLSAAKITDANGRDLLQLPIHEFRPVQNIVQEPGDDQAQSLRFTATSNDPSTEILLQKPVILPAESEILRKSINALPVFLLLFGSVLFVSGAVAIASEKESLCDTQPAAKTALPQDKTTRWLLVAGILVAIFKMWLVSGQTISAFVDAGHDDQAFINLAYNVLGGRWLGPYNQFTLMKGPMYSLFIAGVFLLGIPLFTAQHMLYAMSCALVVRALRPFRLNPWMLFTIFLVLLFNPITYDTSDHLRVIRQQLLLPLTLTIVSSGVALYARRKMPVQKLLPWSLLGGIALPAFWMTREEGVWMIPAITLLWGALFFALWQERPKTWTTRALIISLPFFLWAGGIGMVSWLNYTYYGIFTTCEFRQRDFSAAYGALLRIEPEKWIQYNPVSREMRERAYRFSPTFSELRPYLEGSLGESWARTASYVSKIPPQEYEISHGFFMWALRDAVALSGHAATGREAMSFYRKMAAEINDACDRGLIKAGPRRTGFLPPWRSEYTRSLPKAIQRASLFFVAFEQLTTRPQASGGAPQNYERFEDLTRGRLTPSADAPRIPRRQRWLDSVRTTILSKIMITYQRTSLWVGAASLLAFSVSLGSAIFRRKPAYFVIVSSALLGACTGLVVICALVETVSFQGICSMYFSGAYGLWLLFVLTSWLALAQVLRRDSPVHGANFEPEEKP